MINIPHLNYLRLLRNLVALLIIFGITVKTIFNLFIEKGHYKWPFYQLTFGLEIY